VNAAGIARLISIDVSELDVSTLAANAVVNRGGADAQLTCETRDAAVPRLKLPRNASPREYEGDLISIQVPRAPAANA
jgi:hypothetical protein